MISEPDLRHIVESAFFPMKCVCTISPYHTMTVKVFDEHAGSERLTVRGVDTAPLTSMRDVVGLIRDLKGEMKLREAPPRLQVKKTRRCW